MGDDLFQYREEYPDAPGFKARETSEAAAEHMRKDGRATLLREKCFQRIGNYTDGLTADECAGILEESVLSVRPRFSELAKSNRIEDSGSRRKNFSGRSAVVWRVTKVDPL